MRSERSSSTGEDNGAVMRMRAIAFNVGGIGGLEAAISCNKVLHQLNFVFQGRCPSSSDIDEVLRKSIKEIKRTSLRLGAEALTLR